MDPIHDNIEVTPVVVLSQTFPARPSSIPGIRDFVRRSLAQSPLSEEDNRAVGEAVARALLDAAGPTGTIQVSFRIFPDHAEVDVLKSQPTPGAPNPEELASFLGTAPADAAEAPAAVDRWPGAGLVESGPDGTSFADWMGGVLRRQGLTMEAAARQLGVSVKTVSRWVGGTTEPRLRDLRRIREIFGELPFH
ncbi:helix-turn-helix domain-containing protein [Phytohabitans rumicis]|uniref:XRE family transcriptional regulator n=1 Tax=Phytohabitans rumicis TaxID=1076125 RepID=A0A6V8LEX8_9ACTN|nr:helix-turn-helix domain-containing protein [Phytohabitans rumicis]GFJ94220.1 XRE family transcriptional regulator [Phytohabitans rumicis]